MKYNSASNRDGCKRRAVPYIIKFAALCIIIMITIVFNDILFGTLIGCATFLLSLSIGCSPKLRYFVYKIS